MRPSRRGSRETRSELPGTCDTERAATPGHRWRCVGTPTASSCSCSRRLRGPCRRLAGRRHKIPFVVLRLLVEMRLGIALRIASDRLALRGPSCHARTRRARCRRSSSRSAGRRSLRVWHTDAVRTYRSRIVHAESLHAVPVDHLLERESVPVDGVGLDAIDALHLEAVGGQLDGKVLQLLVIEARFVPA